MYCCSKVNSRYNSNVNISFIIIKTIQHINSLDINVMCVYIIIASPRPYHFIDILTHSGRDKMPPFCRWHFQIRFPKFEWNCTDIFKERINNNETLVQVMDGRRMAYRPVFIPVMKHFNDVKMGAITSQITSLMIVFSTVYLDTDQRKHQSSASMASVRGIHRRPVNSPHKWPVTRKMFPFDDVIMTIDRRCEVYLRVGYKTKLSSLVGCMRLPALNGSIPVNIG